MTKNTLNRSGDFYTWLHSNFNQHMTQYTQCIWKQQSLCEQTYEGGQTVQVFALHLKSVCSKAEIQLSMAKLCLVYTARILNKRAKPASQLIRREHGRTSPWTFLYKRGSSDLSSACSKFSTLKFTLSRCTDKMKFKLVSLSAGSIWTTLQKASYMTEIDSHLSRIQPTN